MSSSLTQFLRTVRALSHGLRPHKSQLLRYCVQGMICTACLMGCRRDNETNGPSTSGKTDFLLITLDTTRADHIGAFGGPKGLTPNMDALAAESARFQKCIAQSATTPISHASMLTGLYPHHHHVRVILAKSGFRLPEDVPYLPSILKQAGWVAGAFLSAFPVSEFYGFNRGFDVFDSGVAKPTKEALHLRPDGTYSWDIDENQRRSDKTTDRAIGWLEGLKGGHAFFLWVHYWDPHDFLASFPETLPPQDFLAPFLTSTPQEGEARHKAIYQAEVAYMDQQFGRLIGKLKSMGRYENTVIVVVADHGQGLGQHGWWFHRILYQEQIHLPLIVRVPGWPMGQDIGSLVRSIDIFPTVLEALGFDDTGGIDGKSLKGLMHGKPEPPRRAYAELLSKFDMNARIVQQLPTSGNMYCLMEEQWKLIWRLDYPAESELYDLALDPGETHNVIRAVPEQAERLRKLLEGMKVFRDQPFPDLGDKVTAAEIRALEGLGYVDGGHDPESSGGDRSGEVVDSTDKESETVQPTTQPAPQ